MIRRPFQSLLVKSTRAGRNATGFVAALLCGAGVTGLPGCSERERQEWLAEASTVAATGESATLVASRPDSVSSGPVRVQALDLKARPAVFAQLGPAGPHRLVFLHGMCGHGLGYAQSFQHAASRKGRLIAPQADILCGTGPWAKWSGDVQQLDARIVAAFEALGAKAPIEDVTVMGYSQGAARAEALARRYPARYTRLVLMGAPNVTSPAGLSGLKAAVMMAGERDRQDLMKAGQRKLQAAKIPSTFMLLPGATHGAMGQNPEQSMGAALDWLFENSRELAPAEPARGATPAGSGASG